MRRNQTEFLPEYELYGRAAPLMRNDMIVKYADVVLAFWDGQSRGTAYAIRKCRELNKPCRVLVRTEKIYKDFAKNTALPPESKQDKQSQQNTPPKTPPAVPATIRFPPRQATKRRQIGGKTPRKKQKSPLTRKRFRRSSGGKAAKNALFL